MGYLDFTNGNTLPDTDLDTLSTSTVLRCTSGTRPTVALTKGMTIFETDTDKLQQYTTTTTTWRAPWNLPWGEVASSVVTTPPGASASTVNLTTLAFTAVQNRRYRVTGQVYSCWNSALAQYAVTLQDGASANFAQQLVAVQASGSGGGVGATIVGRIAHTAATGSVTYKFTVTPSSGTLTSAAGATNPILLTIEDCGPNAAPA